MAESRSPREVFLELVNSIADGRAHDVPGLYAEQTHVAHPFDPLHAPALHSRDELRAAMPAGARPPHRSRPANITVHETTDPEVIIAEFEYQKTDPGTGAPVAQPAIFVLRVRDGEIVSSRDYHDYFTSARLRGQLGALCAAVTGPDAAGADTAG